MRQTRNEYEKLYHQATAKLEQNYANLLARVNNDQAELQEFKNQHTNKKLELLLRDKYSTQKSYVSRNRILQGDEPIYRLPVNHHGRAQFYAAYKIIGPVKVPTVIFNILIIWFLTGILIIALYFDLLRKILAYIERWRLTRQAELRDRIFYNPMAFIKPNKKK